MTVPVIVWVVVGASTLIALLALLLGLVRQLKRLMRTVAEFNREVQPVLAQMQRDAAAAQERSAELQRKGQAMAEERAKARRQVRR